ncbi:MAG: ArsR/SmtB family transcription factor [bacterium]
MDSRIFQALSEEIRLEIISLLASGEINVTELKRRIGAPQPTISRHLKVLSDAGLVRSTRRGKHVYYKIETSVVKKAADFMDTILAKGEAKDYRKRKRKQAVSKRTRDRIEKVSRTPVFSSADWEMKEEKAAPKGPSDIDDFLL